MCPVSAQKPWKKTLRAERRGIPTGRHVRVVRTQKARD